MHQKEPSLARVKKNKTVLKIRSRNNLTFSGHSPPGQYYSKYPSPQHSHPAPSSDQPTTISKPPQNSPPCPPPPPPASKGSHSPSWALSRSTLPTLARWLRYDFGCEAGAEIRNTLRAARPKMIVSQPLAKLKGRLGATGRRGVDSDSDHVEC